MIDNSAGSSSDGIYVYIQGTGGLMTIENNPVEDSGRYGIYLTGATNSVVSGNDIVRNSYGMYLYSSSNNAIFRNDFIDNANYHAKDDGTSNSWDDGYPTGGNYWSDYTGVDTFSGADQNVLGSDGIGDTHYGISGSAGALDHYPLMQPWSPTPHKGDSNNDGKIDFWDFMDFVDAYDTTIGDPEYRNVFDFDNDGKIDFWDFMDFVDVYDTLCP